MLTRPGRSKPGAGRSSANGGSNAGRLPIVWKKPATSSSPLPGLTCRGTFIQSQLEPRIGLRHLARLVQRSGGGAGRGCAAGRTLPGVWC